MTSVIEEELRLVIKNNLENIYIVDDILEIPEIQSISVGSYDSCLNDDELYEKLRSIKKEVQLKLNSYKSAEQYSTCQVLNENMFSKTCVQDSTQTLNIQISTNDEESVLIDYVCQYIKYYQLAMYRELKSKEKNENIYTRSQIVRSQSHINFNNFSISGDSATKSCDKCSFINRKSLVNCELCFSPLSNSSLNKTHNYNSDKKTLSWPLGNKPIKSSQIKLINKNNSLLKRFYRFLFRFEFHETEKWKCNKCEMENTTIICEACLNSSPYLNKWKCDKCTCLNKYSNEKCRYCKSINPNLILCPDCKKLKIASERIICDNCWIKKYSFFMSSKFAK